MPSIADLYAGLTDYARSKLKQLYSLYARGLGPGQANHILKETSSPYPDKRKGIQPHEALQVWRTFKEARSQTVQALPLRRSDWFRGSNATPTDFNSPFGFKYLIDFDFQVINPLTNKPETVTNTIGLSRVARRGVIDDIIAQRMEDLQRATERNIEQYLPGGSQIVEGSAVITGFYRTTNR